MEKGWEGTFQNTVSVFKMTCEGDLQEEAQEVYLSDLGHLM